MFFFLFTSLNLLISHLSLSDDEQGDIDLNDE